MAVIVVGGGVGGLFVAKMLAAKKVEVTLVSVLDYWDYSISSGRCIVSPEDCLKYKYTYPMAKICGSLKCKFVQGKVVEVSATGVTLADGTELKAAAVVIACGGSYASGGIWKARPDETTAAKRLEGFRAMAKDVAAAANVVVGGGGLVGQEVAGEIKAAHPSKTVTLVGTLGGGSPKFLAKTKAALEKLGVVLIPGRAGPLADGATTITVKNGAESKEVKCDLYLPCAGFVYDASMCSKAFGGAITEKGQLAADDCLRVKGAANVFAVGDIVEVPAGGHAPPSGFGKAEAHAKVVVPNVLALLKGAKPAKKFIWSTKPIPTPCIAALGPNVGVGDLGMPGFMGGLESMLARSFKCTSFFMHAKVGAIFGIPK